MGERGGGRALPITHPVKSPEAQVRSSNAHSLECEQHRQHRCRSHASRLCSGCCSRPEDGGSGAAAPAHSEMLPTAASGLDYRRRCTLVLRARILWRTVRLFRTFCLKSARSIPGFIGTRIRSDGFLPSAGRTPTDRPARNASSSAFDQLSLEQARGPEAKRVLQQRVLCCRRLTPRSFVWPPFGILLHQQLAPWDPKQDPGKRKQLVPCLRRREEVQSRRISSALARPWQHPPLPRHPLNRARADKSDR